MPRAKAASSAARISAALTIGESNQSSDFFFLDFFLELELSLLFFFLLTWREDFDDFRWRENDSAGTRTKSLPRETLRKLAVSGRVEGAGCRRMPRAICSASFCR
jgi:hypothetical protein